MLSSWGVGIRRGAACTQPGLAPPPGCEAWLPKAPSSRYSARLDPRFLCNWHRFLLHLPMFVLMKFSRMFPLLPSGCCSPSGRPLVFDFPAALLSIPVALGHSHCGFCSLLVTTACSHGLLCLLPSFFSAPHGELARVGRGIGEASAWVPLLASHAGPGDLEPVPNFSVAHLRLLSSGHGTT